MAYFSILFKDKAVSYSVFEDTYDDDSLYNYQGIIRIRFDSDLYHIGLFNNHSIRCLTSAVVGGLMNCSVSFPKMYSAAMIKNGFTHSAVAARYKLLVNDDLQIALLKCKYLYATIELRY